MPENLDVRPPEGYTFVRMLGRGGMGTVVQARQLETGRLVALKYLHLTAGDLRERFLREGRLASELVHPNIVQGLGIEFVDDSPVLVFEFVEGTDLRSFVLERTKLAAPQAIELAKQILGALSCAHAKGIVHRDLKTANVMVTAQGVAKLADFGTAHLREAHEKLTRTGLVLGTPAYMAPEQAAGLTIDGRSDLYSVGVILFEMLSGKLPFAASNPMALLLVLQADAPPRVDEVAPEVPRWLADVIDICLAKKAEHRYPTAEALIAALDQQGRATRSVKTMKNIPVLSPAASMNATSAGDLPALPALENGAAPSRPRRTTGRVRTLNVSSVAVPQPAPGPPKWALALGAVALLALGALGARLAMPPRPAATSSPGGATSVALAVPLVVLNEKDGAFFTRLDGRAAFAFRTDTKDPLTATLIAGGKDTVLRGLARHTNGDVHAFEAPAELLIRPFHVRLSRGDGRPVQTPVLTHPGLWSIIEDWHRRVPPIEAKPVPRDIWPELLTRLATAVEMPNTGAAFAAMAKVSGPPSKEDIRLLSELARRAAPALQPLLAAAPVVLDLPLAEMPLAKKKLAYLALTPARILDRALLNADLANLVLGAEAALGQRFATVEERPSPLKPILQKDLPRVAMTSAGMLQRGGEDGNVLAGFVSDTPLSNKKEITSYQAELKLPPPTRTQAARLDFQVRNFQGAPEPLPPDELVFFELPDEKWLLLLHAGSRAAEKKDDLTFTRRIVHRIEPELLKPRTLIQYTREVLRSSVRGQRRASSIWIYRIWVRVGDEVL